MVDPAELFEAISHPERIKILKILSKKPSSFASLKRQLGIQSSGNLDYHLKKLSQLVTVREDGLYGLTDAGKEALLSVEAIEMWTEMKRHKLRVPSEIPRAAFFSGLPELCATALLLWYFFAIMQVPSDSPLGYAFFGVLLLAGFSSSIGIFLGWKWISKVMLSKSAVIMLMSLFLLHYLWWTPKQPSSVAISYLLFVAAEAILVFVALIHPLNDFLALTSVFKQSSFTTIIGGVLCLFSGALLVLLEIARPHLLNTQQPSFDTVFGYMNDLSILCGFAIAIGGILILLRSYVLGALMSIIFGLFPPLNYEPTMTYHVFDIIVRLPALQSSGPFSYLVAGLVGSLPIIGAILALFNVRRIRA